MKLLILTLLFGFIVLSTSTAISSCNVRKIAKIGPKLECLQSTEVLRGGDTKYKKKQSKLSRTLSRIFDWIKTEFFRYTSKKQNTQHSNKNKKKPIIPGVNDVSSIRIQKVSILYLLMQLQLEYFLPFLLADNGINFLCTNPGNPGIYVKSSNQLQAGSWQELSTLGRDAHRCEAFFYNITTLY